MGTAPIPLQAFEQVFHDLVEPVVNGSKSLDNADFDRIRQLLRDADNGKWSYRPRHYTLFRMTTTTNITRNLEADDYKDIAIPYNPDNLPISLTPSARQRFLQIQERVASDAADLEKAEGRHQHFAKDADEYFDIIRPLGQGGHAAVDHVRSKLSFEHYARKRIYRKNNFSGDKRELVEYENEIRNLKGLSHRHCVKFVGSYTDPCHVGLIMFPVADCDLKIFLDRKSFSREDFVMIRGYFGCIATALYYLHDRRVRHKDLKPANILIKDGNVLLTDFGTARDCSELSRSTTKGPPGAITRAYAAPEVVNGGERSSSSDIWSLGCVYLDMITILKEKTTKDRKVFFGENGSHDLDPCDNLDTLELWLNYLGSNIDDQPLSWIRSMMKASREHRPTIFELLERIHHHQDEPVYYGPCCHGERGRTDSHQMVSSPGYHEDNDDDSNSSIDLQMVEPARDKETSEATRILLENDFDVRKVELNPESALHWSAKSGFRSVLKLLIEMGADVKLQDISGKSPLHHTAVHGHHTSIQLLVNHGANLNARSNNGDVPLHWAARNGHDKVVRLLLENGAEVNAMDELGGRTPLYWASKNGHDSVVCLLLEHHANIAIKDEVNKGTALHVAASEGHDVVVQRLLNAGASPAEMDKNMSALHWAARNGHEKVVQILLHHGEFSSSKLVDKGGKVALDWATENGHGVVVRMLQDHQS